MNPHWEDFLFVYCILSCCFFTDLSVEVTSKNIEEHFVFELKIYIGIENNEKNFPFKKLRNRLYSNNTNITKISENAFENIQNCEIFEINNCKQLSSVPENLFHEKQAFQNVTVIKFLNTGIKNLPEHLFRELLQLIYLELYDNQLESLHPDLFQSNKKLQTVKISGNKLLNSLATGLFKNNRELTYIEIRKNKLLKTLQRQLFPSLVQQNEIEFQLQKNSLKYIEDETFSNIDFSKVKHLDMSNNYLVCLPNYFLNATRIPENTRRNINLTGNCFDESSEICKLYTCKYRSKIECADPKLSENLEICQEQYEHTKDEDKIDTKSLHKYTNEKSKIDTNHSDKDTKNEYKNDTNILNKDTENKFNNNTNNFGEDAKNESKNDTNIMDEVAENAFKIYRNNSNRDTRNEFNNNSNNNTMTFENRKNRVTHDPNISGFKQNKIVFDPMKITLVAFYILLVCLFVTLLGLSFYFSHKRRYWITSAKKRGIRQSYFDIY